MNKHRTETLRKTVAAMAEFREVFGGDLTPDLVAEVYAADKLGLELCERRNAPGFDALDREGRRYQIKYRSPATLNLDVNNFDFDYIVLVNLDARCEVDGMWLATMAQAKAIFASRDKFRKSQVTQNRFKAVAQRIV